MAKITSRQKKSIVAAAVVGVGAMLATLAIIWPGYEEQETPVQTGSVWALQTGEGTRYARVNTALGELDTVRTVANPSQLVQTENQLLVFTQANATFANVNLALPENLTEPESESLQRSPEGTVSVLSAATTIAYLTDTGAVFTATLADAEETPSQVAFAGDASAATNVIALDDRGLLAAYSAARGSVQVIDVRTGEILRDDQLGDAPSADALQLSLVGGIWFLLDTDTQQMWSAGSDEPVGVSVTPAARLQLSSIEGETVHIADQTGLIRFADGDAQAEQLLTGADVGGSPAAPVSISGVIFAAWLGEGASAGALWSSTGGVTGLSYAGADVGDAPLPVFQVSGQSAILNDTRSGWVWRVPNGDLVPSSQSWVSVETETEAETENDEQADQVIEPKPPVAVDDSFGVRANSQVALQVMLNDSDPNNDVLSVAPESVSGLAADFGSVSLGENNQYLIVTVAPSAAGSAQFQYRVTDGTRADGQLSNIATVTLTVVPENINRAPIWCGVDACLASWPAPEIIPGGTSETRVLAGWVDPDGDPIFVSNAKNLSTVGTVSFTPSGSVLYQHPNPNQESETTVAVEVTVSDDRAATATKQLSVRVTPNPNLIAPSFATSGVTSQPLTVSPLAQVTGVSGVAQLTAVESLDAQRSKATLNANASRFEFTATEPGSFLVRYTVRDSLAERTGLVRILMQTDESATFSAPPLTAFVWPQEDATIDLISGMNNPTGRVLLVADAQPAPRAGAAMSTDVVSEQFLRINGSSETGESGLLGRVQYEVADSASPQRAIGQVTVILMPAREPGAPIAVDDRLTVRAGSQVDIPVLENDAAAPGASLTLDPQSVTNTDDQSLAFASGRLLRYLAPDQPGTYQLGYSVYTSGYPQLTDNATVTVTVLGSEANRKPQPQPLVGRVLSGETVTIPFDSFGVDPDGDAVELDQILSQPDSGSAAISADGSGIEYTSVEGFAGQVSFEYQVRDSFGEAGSARVSVGVRNAAVDPRPIVYTDIVQVQAGESSTVVVEPLVNDIDPLGSQLTLVRVTPNAQPESAEFEDLERRIVSRDDSAVLFRAGTTLGSFSFTYTVENSDGDSAIGLIVLQVIRETVTDAPIVTDTLLDIETREQFPRGVDVLEGKVRWATGNIADLTMTLWGNPSDLTARGSTIQGPLPKTTRIVPFQVSGVGFDGEERVSYGFLRVPGEDDLRLSLRSNIPRLVVDEGESVTFDLDDMVATPAGGELELLTAGIKASGTRANSQCELVSATSVRYDAGRGAPWRDSCTVPIRLVTQSTYTYLTVPISINADVPQPELRPGAITVSPGETLTYDLVKMVTWTGGENWSELQLAVDAGGADFTTELAGTLLTIRGSDRVKPGTQQTATVSVLSSEGVSPAPLTIRAGPSPSTLPKGATITQQCSQADGTSCDINVIGAPGEVNPLPGTALELVSVDSPEMCPNVSFSVLGANTVRATWTDAAFGAACTANFVVKDAQERQSLGDRVGSVTLDLLGFPQAPGSVTLKSFGDKTVTLAVNPGAASNAYPAIGGFVILRDGSEVANCSVTGQDCSPITGLTNGERVTFEARSVNSVGESRRENPSITTWAYRAPKVDSVTATPTYVATQTTPTQGAVSVVIATGDPEVRAFTVTGANGEVARTSTRTQVDVIVSTTTPVITVTPLSEFDAPDGGTSSGSAVTVGIRVAGSPTVGALTQASVGSSSITANPLAVDANGSVKPTEVIYLAYQAGGSATCQVSTSGGSLSATVVNGTQSNTPTISGLQSNVRYTVKACASNGFGLAESNTFTAIPFNAPTAPSGYQYSVTDGSSTGNYLAEPSPGSAPPAGFTAVYSGRDVFGSELNITVAFCLIDDLTRCSESSAVTPVNSSATVQFRASVNPAPATVCQIGVPLTVSISADGVVGTLTNIEVQTAGSPDWVALANSADPIPENSVSVRAKYQWTSPGTTALTPYLFACTP